MTKAEIKAFIERVDPGAKHHYAVLDDGGSYTVWAETERLGLDEDDGYGELGWAFEIVRFTRDEFDVMPDEIEKALVSHPLISFTYNVSSEPESGYIIHTFRCEA